MQTIYKPKGRAGEYAEYALNLYRGCNHKCGYCYAPVMLRMSKVGFYTPHPREGILEALKKKKNLPIGQQVFLCFATDPYNSADVQHQLTRQAIRLLHESDVYVRILSKAGRRSERDFDLLGQQDSFGATLTFCETKDESIYEPEAAPWRERLTALRIANKLGIHTWASIEPVIQPNQSLALIEKSLGFVDEYKLGKWNYSPEASKINWRLYLNEAIRLLERNNKKYFIKQDLEDAAERG